MNIAELRYWLWKNNVRVYEDENNLMKRHHLNNKTRLLETPEIRNALGKFRQELRAIFHGICHVCGDCLEQEREADWTYDACPRSVRHLSVGFAHDQSFMTHSCKNGCCQPVTPQTEEEKEKVKKFLAVVEELERKRQDGIKK